MEKETKMHKSTYTPICEIFKTEKNTVLAVKLKYIIISPVTNSQYN